MKISIATHKPIGIRPFGMRKSFRNIALLGATAFASAALLCSCGGDRGSWQSIKRELIQREMAHKIADKGTLADALNALNLGEIVETEAKGILVNSMDKAAPSEAADLFANGQVRGEEEKQALVVHIYRNGTRADAKKVQESRTTLSENEKDMVDRKASMSDKQFKERHGRITFAHVFGALAVLGLAVVGIFKGR